MNIISICENPDILKVMRIINIIIKIIRVIVPILLILSLSIKFMKAAGNDDELDKVKKTAVMNVIAAILVFFLPSFVSLIARLTMGNSDYTNCIEDISLETIYAAYEKQEDNYIATVEDTLNINDYYIALNNLVNIKDADKYYEYSIKLEEIKEEIDEINHPQIKYYSKIDYSNFKWTYYKAGTGPLKDYETNFAPYAIYAPNNASDLNGVSLPLIIWLHGSGEISAGESTFLNSGLLKVVKEWNKYKLEPIPAIIVAPQATVGWWGGHTQNHKTIRALVKYTKEKYNIDSSHIVLMGHSMGGNGTIEIAWEMKDLNLYSAVTMSTRVENYKSNEGGQEFFSKLKMKGYGEIAGHQKFYDWIGQSNNYTYYKGASHGKVPEMALTEDKNNNNISDLMEFLFDDLNINSFEIPNENEKNNNSSSSNSNSGITKHPELVENPITNYVSVVEMSSLIARTAKGRGLYTREAVVAVATTVINYLDSNYNYHIPYLLGGRYSVPGEWGINPKWGTKIIKDNEEKISGLDCRNFVIWTFKQAGLSLNRGYGIEGSIQNDFDNKYPSIKDGRPGDVIDANKHIMLIVSKDSNGYTVAESSGSVRLKYYTFEFLSNDGYCAYNMDAVYNNTAKSCTLSNSYRPYSGSCRIPSSELPSYY